MLARVLTLIIITACGVVALQAQSRPYLPQQSVPPGEDAREWVRPHDAPAEPWPTRASDILHMNRVHARGRVEDQRTALRLLRLQVQADRVRSTDAEVLALLQSLVLTGIRTERVNPPQPGDSSEAHILLRVEAVQLLSWVGGPETEPILVELLARERDALVLAFAVAASRSIAKAPSSELEAQLLAVAQRNNSMARDEALSRELIQTTVAFYLDHGHNVSPAMFRELMQVAATARSQETRRLASGAVQLLRGIGY